MFNMCTHQNSFQAENDHETHAVLVTTIFGVSIDTDNGKKYVHVCWLVCKVYHKQLQWT